MWVEAEMLDTIRGAVPEIIELLKDESSGVRSGGADALAKLSEHGES
jgi:HEAT repeat protein